MNFNFYHTLASRSEIEIQSILSILLPYKISHFGYVKIFKNDTHLVLTTHVEWLECFYKNYYVHGISHKKYDSYSSGYQLWSLAADAVTMTVMKNDFRIDHGITLINKQPDFCELFCYATTPDNPFVINWYINNLDILEKFSYFFKEKMASLIQKAEVDRTIFPKVISSLDSKDLFPVENSTKVTKDMFKIKPILSPQELFCAQQIMRGNTIKKTANILKLSPRTVEYYLNSAKVKLNAKNITHLCVILSSK